MTESPTVVVVASLVILLLLAPACALFFGGVPSARGLAALTGTAVAVTFVAGVAWLALGAEPAIALYQGAISAVSVTCVLAIGLRTESYRSMAAFIAPWLVLVLVPVEHALFDVRAGLLVSSLGTLDFAGSAAIGVCTGVAGSAIAWVSGRGGNSAAPVRSWVLLLSSGVAAMLGFVALGLAAELVVDDSSVTIVRNTVLAAGAGAVGWALAQLVNVRRPTLAGASAGLIAGPVAALSGLPWFDPIAVVVLALGGAILGHVVTVAARAGGAGVWSTLVGVMLLPGALGLVATGILARQVGLLYSGHVDLVAGQLSGLLAVLGYSAVVSGVIAVVALRLTRPPGHGIPVSAEGSG